MYNKLFSKIVDSSIWLEPTPTRIVWLMFIAVMNEDGFVQFASVANVAHRARIKDDEAEEAIRILESPDPNSADDENEGRRIEKVPGGWMILNASKYRDLVTREMQRAATRERVKRHRQKTKSAVVTPCNANVTERNGSVTQSDTYTDTKKKSTREARPSLKDVVDFFGMESLANAFWDYYESNGWKVGRNPMKDWKAAARRWQREQKPFTTSFTKRKERAPIYPKLPERREPTEQELEEARAIARQETEALRQRLRTA